VSFGRRRFLQGAAIFGAAAAAGAVPVLAEAAEERVHPERVTFHLPGLDPAHDGLRIAQLSDVHVGPNTSPEVIRQAVERANDFDPDLVFLTGDFLSRSPGEVEGVRTLLAGLAAPTVAVLGNHDISVNPEGTAEALRANGYEVLENAWTRIRVRGVPLPVVGVGDLLTGREDVAAAVRGLPRGATPLVLAHAPRTADRLRGLERPLLCLSGHTHGGQINLPIVTPLLLASMREPYARGHFQLGRVQLYVNRGIGMSGLLRVRINAPAEVTLATVRRAEPGAIRTA
jgi:predicted MPP superfamily phosphohydrolase